MGNEKLVRVKSCPWCRSELRTPNNIFDEKTNHYITSLLGTSEDLATELVKEMKGFKCLSCQTTYLDPWFTEDSMSNYFNNQKSVHKVGWGNFRQLVVNEFTSPASEINTEIITILRPEFKTLVKEFARNRAEEITKRAAQILANKKNLNEKKITQSLLIKN